MNSGVLLICENNRFIGICSTGFGALEARAACRQMGYVDGGTVNVIAIILVCDIQHNLFLYNIIIF